MFDGRHDAPATFVAIHFVTKFKRAIEAGSVLGGHPVTVSMITARSLSALPGLIVAQCGEDRLTAVCERAGLPASLPQNLHREF